MGNGVGDDHLLLVFRKLERVVDVKNQIQYIQWEPSDGENEGDGHQKFVPSPQPLHIICIIRLDLEAVFVSSERRGIYIF